MLRRTRFLRVEGANFSSSSAGQKAQKKNPRRPSRPFIQDERPPPSISLEWVSYMTFARWCAYLGLIYAAVDFSRFMVYRLAPSTIPVQPAPSSTIVSSTVPLVAPCKRYPSSSLIVTETCVENDTAFYMPPQASSSLQHDLPHHKPRRSLSDRAREVHAFFGAVAERIASSLVVINVQSPYASGETAPPRAAGADTTGKASSNGGGAAAVQIENAFRFDLPPSQWPTKEEQEGDAQRMREKQEQRLREADEDVWGRRGMSKQANRPNSLPGFLSWANSRFDRPSSPDWTLPKHMEDTSNNTLIDANAPVSIVEDEAKLRSVKSIEDLPRRGGAPSSSATAAAGLGDKQLTAAQKKSWVDDVAKAEKELIEKGSNSSSTSSGTEVFHNEQNSIDDKLHRFLSFQFEPGRPSNRADNVVSSSPPPTELIVKCAEATQPGAVGSRCSVDNSVLCAPRHRSMLAALAMLPDPLPAHLQIATFGAGPTAVAGFLFKFMSQHIKRLDVVTEPALLEHGSIVDFGLTSRAGPVTITDADDEDFMLRTNKKYDLLFLSPCDPITGQRGGASLSPAYVQLVRKTLSNVGVAAFEMRRDDYVSQEVVRRVFGERNVFMFSVPKARNDVVALAGYSLPNEGGLHKRHIVHRAEDISYAFRLPYDLGAHLPMDWMFW